MGGGTPLGYRGRQVLALVSAIAAQGGRPPSYAMIADALGMSGVSEVCKVVRRLERRGFLHRADIGARHRQGWRHPVIVVAARRTPTISGGKVL